MFSEATSGLKCAHGFSRSSTDIVGAPPVVMLITTFVRSLDLLQERLEGLGRLVGAAVLRIARVQVHERGAGFGGGDRGLGDLLGGDRQVRRHRRRVDRAGDRAGDHHLAAFAMDGTWSWRCSLTVSSAARSRCIVRVLASAGFQGLLDTVSACARPARRGARCATGSWSRSHRRSGGLPQASAAFCHGCSSQTARGGRSAM